MENVLDPTHVDYAHHGVAGEWWCDLSQVHCLATAVCTAHRFTCLVMECAPSLMWHSCYVPHANGCCRPCPCSYPHTISIYTSTGYDAANAIPLDLKLVEDKGPRGFVFQTLPADPTRRGIYGQFNPPCNVT